MKYETLICFCLPTCNVEDMFKYLLPSLQNIGELKKYASFSITFQPPYTSEDVQKVLAELERLNLNYKYEVKEYEFDSGETPLIQMRNDCALRYPKALFYAMLDDDMQFLPGIDKDYLNAVNYMLSDRNASVAIFSGPINDKEFAKTFDLGLIYADFENASYYTDAGIIYRGGIYYNFDGLLPEDMLKYVGGRQDVLTAIWRIVQGESSIMSANAKCLHYQHRKEAGHSEYGWLNNNAFRKPTCISWLESVGYIAHILPIFQLADSVYYNFSKARCEELYKLGCKSTLHNGDDKLQESSYPIEQLLPILDEKLNNLNI